MSKNSGVIFMQIGIQGPRWWLVEGGGSQVTAMQYTYYYDIFQNVFKRYYLGNLGTRYVFTKKKFRCLSNNKDNVVS